MQEPYIGLDLDDAVVNGNLTEYARSVVNKCRSYTEYSPSGTGVHIFLKGSLPNAIKTPTFEAYQKGRYLTVTEKPLLSLPIRAVDTEFILSLAPIEGRKRPLLSDVLTNIKDGSRNNDLFKLAASLRDKGYSIDVIYGLLEPKAKELNFPLNELELLVRSAGRYTPSIQPELELDGSLASFMRDQKPVPYIVEEILAENTISIITGLPESRKSWLLLDLGVALASGTTWLNRFPTKQKRVMMIDQERPRTEMQRRIKALMTSRGLSVDSLEGRLMPFAGTTTRLNRDDSFDSLKRRIADKKPDVLLIDSLKTFQSEDITNNQAMQHFMERVKELRSQYSLTIVFLHHENKGGYVRSREGQEVSAETIAGAAVLSEVPETLFIAAKTGDDASILYHIKNSYGPKMPPQLFKVVDTKEDRSAISVQAL